MATLALSTAGAALGGSFLPGFSALGATISGAAIGRAAGAIAGRFIDQALFAPSGQDRLVEGPRLDDLHILSSGIGAPVPRLYGRARIGGQVIWGPPFEEAAVTTQAGGSGGGKASQPQQSGGSRVDYRYYASFAVGLCEGKISRIGRIWADGKELDLSNVSYRLHRGGDGQQPDSLIVSHEGEDNTPAYRGLAYIVFERLSLERFGNRLPQLSFEVFRPIDGFEQKIKAITIIPGAGEFAYDTNEVIRLAGGGTTFPENTHTQQGDTDWCVSMDMLQASAPSLRNASLVVSWFGTDLRVGHCELRPGVERVEKTTSPYAWSVQGLPRASAHVVSQIDGRPAFGGTPADRSVVAALKDLSARGLGSTFYPFILMDVAPGNGLTDPYGAGEQAAFPWRGRITVDPAPGLPGSPDKTIATATDVAAFVGAAAVSDFTIVGEAVYYSGPAEWSYRRMILHYAHLCKAAGGVDAFLIGSELRGLTWLRDGAGGYPFVQALMQLADDVKSVLDAQTKVTYAADWSEYFGHQPADGSGDVAFHLDPLWASPSIDAIGIDCYWPLADWRHEGSHLDKDAGAPSIYDLNYLRNNITSGEGFEWYYATPQDRVAQVRTSITDGAGKPWVYRFKDLVSWWKNPHFARPGGVESATATAWIPESKPVWFTEVGCPAVDLGANQPNVFVDPKSAESHLPYFSQGRRDDLMQRRYLTAMLRHYDPSDLDFDDAQNPVSTVYGGRMLATDRMYCYTWDARPDPVFPRALSVWSDGANWTLGHWLTGRLGGLDLARLVAHILDEYGFAPHDASKLEGTLHGLVIERLMSARQALQPLELAFFFDGFETGGRLRFCHRGQSDTALTLDHDDLVEEKSGGSLCSIIRAQETDLPASVKLSTIVEAGDYERDAQESRRLETVSSRVATADLPLVMDRSQARLIAEHWLHDTWQARDTSKFKLPPSRLAVEPSDSVALVGPGGPELHRITAVTAGQVADIEARSISPDVFSVSTSIEEDVAEPIILAIGPVNAYFLDLPQFGSVSNTSLGWFAASGSPWPGRVSLYRSGGVDGFELFASATRAATTGVVFATDPSVVTGRWHYAETLTVQLERGALAGLTEVAVLNGGNLAAIQHASGAWEIIQFRSAELVADQTYALRQCLRGQSGTEHLSEQPLPAGALFVLLDEAVVPLSLNGDDRDLPYTWTWGPANRPLGHLTYRTAVHAFMGAGLAPYRPAHLSRRDNAHGTLFSWIRRTRVGGDNWANVEVPLGEDVEAYEIDILDGETVVRTLTSSSTQILYTFADQASDWGSNVPETFSLSVFQMSSVYGRGTPLEVIV